MINSSRSEDRRDRTIKPRDARGFKLPLVRPGEKRHESVEQVTALVRGSRSSAKAQPSETLNDLASCEREIRQGIDAFHRVARAFAKIKAKQLYKQRGYADFKAYCEGEWGWDRDRGYQMANAGEMLQALPAKCRPVVGTERQARALAAVPEEKRVNVLKEASKTGQVTAKSITAAARSRATGLR